MFDHRELVTLIAIFDEGSFEAAAKSLHVTTGAVSQRIKSLENHIGKPVLIRSNPLQLTAAGESIMQLARKIKLLQDEAMTGITGSGGLLRQTLPIAVNHDSLTCWFSDAANNIATCLNKVLIDIKTTDKLATNQMLKSGSVIAAVTALDNPVPGCKIRRLGALEYFAVCSSQLYSQSLSEGLQSDKLGEVSLILFDHDDHIDEQLFRKLDLSPGQLQKHYIPDSREQMKAVLHNVGWAILPRQIISEYADSDIAYLSDTPVYVDLYWKVWDVSSQLIAEVERQVLDEAVKQLYQ